MRAAVPILALGLAACTMTAPETEAPPTSAPLWLGAWDCDIYGPMTFSDAGWAIGPGARIPFVAIQPDGRGGARLVLPKATPLVLTMRGAESDRMDLRSEGRHADVPVGCVRAEG